MKKFLVGLLLGTAVTLSPVVQAGEYSDPFRELLGGLLVTTIVTGSPQVNATSGVNIRLVNNRGQEIRILNTESKISIYGNRRR